MSEITIHPRRNASKPNGGSANHKTSVNRPRRPNYNAIHRNPLPVEVYPLPTLIPHNPLSVVAVALSYLIQVLSPPKRKLYRGYFSSATSSIHITDHETQRALWEQGFFGKGNLSRSEPTWLENQKRIGATAEENTDSRRKERKQFKIERARAELTELEQDLAQSGLRSTSKSQAEAQHAGSHDLSSNGSTGSNKIAVHPGVLEAQAAELYSSQTPIPGPTSAPIEPQADIDSFEEWKKHVDANGLPTPPPTSISSEASQNEAASRTPKRLTRQKTVRFSPTIEAREFDLTDPIISPLKDPGATTVNNTTTETNSDVPSLLSPADKSVAGTTRNQEHLQISLEEAFFLQYGLGVLEILPSFDGNEPLSTDSLFSLFRRHSYFPARSLSTKLEPDDPFLISYAVYHHYRSMGWTVRSGIKFGVDYLLYNRGPAFSHAEFAVVVLPSYSDGRESTTKTWWWLHGINRVQAQVHKSLVLCYVEVPDVLPKPVDGQTDIGKTLSLYKVRDVNVKRWSPNRSRD